jgi:predicted AlkP superfamily pyrophosphatase or phosphodiesterase
MTKVILVLSDGLGYDVAVDGMGFLGHLVETKQASLYKAICELPSMSRPTYETVHTGLPSSLHGFVSNSIVRCSTQPNIFRLASQAGKVTAAAAYFWFSEMYNRVPYNAVEDKETDDSGLPIQHGRFYDQDEYPDPEVFTTAGWLVGRFQPDYLLVHPMGMDHIGEHYGSHSSQYQKQAIRQDAALAPLIMEWSARGYAILVTGDHGINPDGVHGGTTPEMREIPLYLIRPAGGGRGDTREIVSQLQIAPTICRLLDIPIPETMQHPPIS